MGSSNFEELQAQAVAFVQRHKNNIFCTAKGINHSLAEQDLEDLVNEGYAIALELVAEGGLENLRWFWKKLHRSVWESFDYLVDYVDFSNADDPIVRKAGAADPLEKVMEEEKIVSTASSILDFLTTAEKRVLCLMLGLTEKGCCVEVEAANLLGISRSSVRVYLARILVKIQSATRHVAHSGVLVLSRGKPKKVRVPQPASIRQTTRGLNREISARVPGIRFSIAGGTSNA